MARTRALIHRNLRGTNHYAILEWTPAEKHKLSAFDYFLEFDPNKNYADAKTTDLSSDTIGVEYGGEIGPVNLRAAFARQEDAGDSNKSC